MLGWKIKRVVLGVGKVIGYWRWFRAPVEVRALPFEGFVQIAPKTQRHARFKHALIYFAGPGIELLLFLLIAMGLGGFDALFTFTDDYSRIALQSFAFAALIGAVLNLVPQGVTTQEGYTPNDGMGIFLCLFSNSIDYANWVQESQKANQQENQGEEERYF